jgi:hypothetical protein
MTSRSVRLACLVTLAAGFLCACTHSQLDFCPKGLSDPYGNTRP